jgi:uncharacterized protein YcbX
MPAGRVATLRRWPVKSMAGERVGALAVDGFGVAGDRAVGAFEVFQGTRRRVSAVPVPRLLAWSAAYPDDPGPIDRDAPPRPIITAPDGTPRDWEDPELAEALAADVGRALSLAWDPCGQPDIEATVHVTVEASLRDLGATLGAPVDLRRFRSSIHLELDAEPWAELDWIGRRLRVGDAILEVVEGCERCAMPTRDPDTQAKWPQLLRLLAAERATLFGLLLRTVEPAIVREGDSAELLS